MDNLIGRTLDGLYAVRELIGTGGMANVYKAVVVGENGPVPVGTVVAVKVLRQELMHDPDLVRRFKNESKAISLLNHPNIVKVYDVSVSETLQYIVMEYVDGMTLREYLNERGGKLTSRETVHFISQILKALDHAHRNGVVHRDIKPQNIMLLDNGQLRMMDFGIARVSRTGMCSYRCTNRMNHNIFNSKFFFYQSCHILGISLTISMTDKHGFIFITIPSNSFFHHRNQRRKRFLSSSDFSN